MSINELGQPIGQAVAGWTTRPRPDASVLKDRYCWLERLDPRRHAQQLFDADQMDGRGASWTYLPYGPFATFAEYRRWAEKVCDDPSWCSTRSSIPTQPRPARSTPPAIKVQLTSWLSPDNFDTQGHQLTSLRRHNP